jgi:hypothetical protein
MATAGDNYINLTWLNSVGGWEYWTFTARHSYGYDSNDIGRIEKDIFQNWDADFISGQSETEVLGKDVRSFIVVRSQLLSKAQVDAIAKIRNSIKVQEVRSTGNVTVLVDAGSFTYRTDKDKTITIEFRITYPREQIQTL